MANITDYTYYLLGKKFIPNVQSLNAGVSDNLEKINHFINTYERELLIGILGITLYNELNTALDDLPSADIKWQNLVNGTDYVKDGVTYRFDGLRGFDKDSLVAYYVFCKYMENDESYYSTTGTVKSMASNADVFSPTRKYIDAWYLFLDKYQSSDSKDEVNYIIDNYGNFVGVDYYKQQESNKLVTLETYLKDHESDFDGYNFTYYTGTNSLGI